VPAQPTPVGFDINASVGTFRLRVSHPGSAHRLAIVGPSGSGKSVTLRVLAGLLGPDAGTVTYGGADVSRTPTERRRLGYVPQGLGLIPGRTVWQQAVFGIHADPARAAWWLATLHLDGLLDRLPEQLSGGQRQRVSLARALATDPRVVLLDEPFSALDAPVRAELRREFRRLQRDAGLSTILVTHDPEEAAMLADEIVVVSDGQVLQSGSCRDVYQRPASAEVGRLLRIDNLFEDTAGDGVPAGLPTSLPDGTRLLWQVPPEALRIHPGPPPPGGNGQAVDLGQGQVTDVIDLGRVIEVVVTLPAGTELRSRTIQMPGLTVGDSCRVEADPDAVSVWPTEPAGTGTRSDTPRLV
jgi:molybdate transport system permease protein